MGMEPAVASSLGLVWALGTAAALAVAAWRPAWIVEHARWVLAATALGTALAFASLVDTGPLRFHIALDPSTEPLLPAGDPAQAAYRSAVATFGDDEVYVIALECEEVFTVACLESLERVADPIARLPGVRSVRSLLDVTSFRYVPEDDWVEVRPFIGEIPRDPAVLAALRERALRDPVYRRTLVSAEGRAAALNVAFQPMSDAEFLASRLDARIGALLDAERARGRVIHVAGRPHVKVRVYRGMVRDLWRLIPLGIAVMGAMLWLLHGTVRSVVLPLGIAFVANVWMLGAMAVAEVELTILTGLLAPTVLALGSIYGVHVLARYEEEAGRAASAPEAARASLGHLVLPVSVAGLTTVLGFGALLLTDVPAVFELGLFSMLGVAAITVVSLTAAPAALALLPLRAGHQRRAFARRIAGGLDTALERLGRGVARRPAWWIGLAGGLALLAALLVPRIAIDTDYLSYFRPDDPVRLEFEAVNRLLAGAIPIYVVTAAGESGAYREPERLRAVAALQERLGRVPGVSRTVSAIDPLQQLNRAFHGGDPAQERIPDSRSGVAELFFLMPKSELSRFSTVDQSQMNVVVRTGEVGSAAIERLAGALEAAVAASGVEASVTGNAILLARSADGIARRQPLSVAIAALAILALVSASLRSLPLGALAMVPNLVPVLLYFGLLGAGVAPLSLPTSLIGCIALGVAIDDTVHFLVRYRAERATRSPEAATLEAVRRVGRPIVVTSAMLAAGFGLIAASDFQTLQQFGSLTALTMALCLATDLLLLPALLLRLRPG